LDGGGVNATIEPGELIHHWGRGLDIFKREKDPVGGRKKPKSKGEQTTRRRAGFGCRK